MTSLRLDERDRKLLFDAYNYLELASRFKSLDQNYKEYIIKAQNMIVNLMKYGEATLPHLKEIQFLVIRVYWHSRTPKYCKALLTFVYDLLNILSFEIYLKYIAQSKNIGGGAVC